MTKNQFKARIEKFCELKKNGIHWGFDLDAQSVSIEILAGTNAEKLGVSIAQLILGGFELVQLENPADPKLTARIVFK
jgi:hypothetical protein